MVSDEADVVVVIGSGMGGLAAARTIAQFGGKRVLVLEQQDNREWCTAVVR
ncbi:FAD-binding protein [Streptomyces sp. NPDC005827]|uniref:FAD-binding protein n=1 Tax=Streptomyces sp. NPDC005827 TaxID=3157070 RepID=UPI0033C94D01